MSHGQGLLRILPIAFSSLLVSCATSHTNSNTSTHAESSDEFTKSSCTNVLESRHEKFYVSHLHPGKTGTAITIEPTVKKEFVLETVRVPASETAYNANIPKKRVEKVHLGDD